MSTDDTPRSPEQIADLAAEIASQWRDDPNVVAVSLCVKVTGGVARPGEFALGFHVQHKLTEQALTERGWRQVPPEVDGVPTDVIQIHHSALGSVDEKATRSAMFDTLVGGIAVGNADIKAYGTMGMTALAVSDGRMVGLTNEHVLVFDVDGQVGDDVLQPRFHLNSEVSLDPASCCPGGQLHYRGVDNPIVDAAMAVFAAAAIAAAASDRIDPHRRGQDATPVQPGEHTLRETVRMEIDYTELPLPGNPFETGVHWRYERHTDSRVLSHEVTEVKHNEHRAAVQVLVSDRREYTPASVVRLAAAISPDEYSQRCNLFVTAAVLSPSGRTAMKVVLRPWQVGRGPDSHQQLMRSVVDRARTDERHLCFYLGEVRLPKDAERGTWQLFLYAHTLNDVPTGEKPEVAAQTIGGLPVTANFVSAGRHSNILYGERCEIRQRRYGSFVVVDPDPDPVITLVD